METVLLLGATGQLGRLIVESAPQEVKLVCPAHEQLDITDAELLREAISELSPTIIINASAYTAVDKAEEERELAFLVNETAAENIGRFSPRKTKIIHLSTDFVFSKKHTCPYLPNADTCPSSVYGKSKLAGEEALKKTHKEKLVVLRTSWLYSATGKNFVNTIVRHLRKKNQLRVVNDQFGSPTSAQTLAEIVWKFTDTNAEGTYHWSDRGVISWFDFAVEIQKQSLEIGLTKGEVDIHPVPSSEYTTPAKRPEYSALDSAKTENLLGVQTIFWQEQLFNVLSRIKQGE